MLTLEQEMILAMGGNSNMWGSKSNNERGRVSTKRPKKKKTFGKNKKK